MAFYKDCIIVPT